MSIKVGSEVVATDAEGYLVDPETWNNEAAEALARSEDIVLTEDHWTVIAFMREYYESHQIAVDVRHVLKHLSARLAPGASARNHLYQLFPYGYVKQACKIAGMRRPRAWSTG